MFKADTLQIFRQNRPGPAYWLAFKNNKKKKKLGFQCFVSLGGSKVKNSQIGTQTQKSANFGNDDLYGSNILHRLKRHLKYLRKKF